MKNINPTSIFQSSWWFYRTLSISLSGVFLSVTPLQIFKGAVFRRGDIKLSYQASYRDYAHTIPDEGPCPILDYDAPDDVDDILKKSGNLKPEFKIACRMPRTLDV